MIRPNFCLGWILFILLAASPAQNKNIPGKNVGFTNNTKVIYQIPSTDNMPPFGIHEGFREFNGCFQSDCYYTQNEDFFAPNAQDRFDAIIFTAPSFRSDEFADRIVPKQRKPQQRYIMSIREAPWPHLDPPWINRQFLSNNFFNWTWTYRHDSDLLNPNSFIIPKNDQTKKQQLKQIMGLRPNKMPSKFNLSSKSKLVFWVVSNCHTHSRREDYVRIMQEYIDVHVYGHCGDLPCEGKDCFDTLAYDYKFYLAFENALCPDYVTEKFFRTLRLPIVPIVMGGDNYRHLVPTTGYIDVNNFKSVKALTEHLMYLDKNPTAYASYFTWRKDYEMYERWPLCSLCEKLHNPNEPWQTYQDAYDWWYFDDDGEFLCQEGYYRHYFHSNDDIKIPQIEEKKDTILGKAFRILHY